MRVAVIGAGVSGLVSAYLLRDAHDVVLFEAKDKPGGHSWTVDVPHAGQTWPVDTGFIVYNERTYPNFIRLLTELGLSGRPTEMSFSVRDPQQNMEYCSRGLPGVFAQRRNLLRPAHYRMVRDILRFNRESLELLEHPQDISLQDYVRDRGYSDAFVQRYLLPMCAAIWSAPLAEAGAFPAEHFVRFFSNHGLLSVGGQPQWFTVPGGSQQYVQRIAAVLGERIRSGHAVTGIRRRDTGVEVRVNGATETFDRVILACHSNEALALLDDPSEHESTILGGLPYQDNDVLLHTDTRVLPRTRRAWASWNYSIDRDPAKAATLTYHMNRLQGLDAPVEFCVTLNQREAIDPGQVLGEYVYAHPVYTLAANRQRERRAEINGVRNTHFCGAYWYNGFHEDGVRSALDVVHQLGVDW